MPLISRTEFDKLVRQIFSAEHGNPVHASQPATVLANRLLAGMVRKLAATMMAVANPTQALLLDSITEMLGPLDPLVRIEVRSVLKKEERLDDLLVHPQVFAARAKSLSRLPAAALAILSIAMELVAAELMEAAGYRAEAEHRHTIRPSDILHVVQHHPAMQGLLGPARERRPKGCNVCARWLANPTVNPRTGRPINVGGKVYKQLQAECGTQK